MGQELMSTMRAIPSSDGNSRTPPEIHEGSPNLAESNEVDAGREVGSPSNPDLWRKLPSAFRTFTKDHRTWPSRMPRYGQVGA
jgi:hypothetical protein